ncbi:exonuclease domain-containing protein [Holzapfeliella sp. JNUCC 72]
MPKKATTYAVVDLETTGTHREAQDRVIQFGCAIIQKQKIVKTYSFLINPGREIPERITRLTGITDDDVKDAPKFEDLALQLYKILKGTIFVAHNVNFDLPFLNYELEKAGIAPLTNKAIDTVELAQILLPTSESFKLNDLSKRLNIKHTNPHQADSDAIVTAKLLMKLQRKARQLPVETLKMLTELGEGLTRETGGFFRAIYNYKKKRPQTLDKQYFKVKELILKKQLHATPESSDLTDYPMDDSRKKSLFKGKIRFRRSQVNMMNRIHDFLQIKNRHKPLFVEAPNGSGKTFAYLFSYAHKLSPMQKLVIATPTTILQNQIVQTEVPQLNRVLKTQFKAEIVKSSRYYLDLDAFYQTLSKNNQTNYTLTLQLRILVWLLQTDTGDLSELQLTNYQDLLFNVIRHPGDARNATPFSDYDFFNLARERQEQADVLVTNHAYLVNHSDDMVWGQDPLLVVDEAHRFAENTTQSLSDGFQFESFWGFLAHIQSLLTNKQIGLINGFKQDLFMSKEIKQTHATLDKLIKVINDFQRFLFEGIKAAGVPVYRSLKQTDFAINGNDLFPDKAIAQGYLARLQGQLESSRKQLLGLVTQLNHQRRRLLKNEWETIEELDKQLVTIETYLQKCYSLSEEINKEDNLNDLGFVLQSSKVDDPLAVNLRWLLIDPVDPIQNILKHFNRPLFISATLKQQDDFTYTLNSLGYNEKDVQTYVAKTTGRYRDNVKVVGTSDLDGIKNPNDEHYLENISELIPDIISSSDSQHVLLLFTNLENIKEVYYHILGDERLSDYEVLAQGVTGSNEKISKRYTIATNSILLGANSYWEGVDFKDVQHDMVIVTQLPFESPDRADVKLRQNNLTNPFKEDTLPRALIRFQQGFGRLVRKENSKGTFVVLDPRFHESPYATLFQKSLPKLPIKFFNKGELINYLNQVSNRGNQ